MIDLANKRPSLADKLAKETEKKGIDALIPTTLQHIETSEQIKKADLKIKYIEYQDININKNDILNEYVVPLLASKDKNTLPSKISAASLNGYSAIADSLASSKNIVLETNIGNEGKVSSTIWRVFVYFLVVSGLLAYTYAVLKKRK